ncbi:MAG TPA: hypothetical protein PKC30_04800 [Saprospiraceae bacterium]|nr:hypothetical protein [Saprospiraceae bacterium]
MRNLLAPKNMTPAKLFLMDGLGAVLTSSLLLFVLIPLEIYFGMPRHVLFLLAGIAIVFSFYSILCSIFVKEEWVSYLRIICLANLAYCILSLGFVIYFFHRLTALGVAYFFIEILVVAVVITIEKNSIQTKLNS